MTRIRHNHFSTPEFAAVAACGILVKTGTVNYISELPFRRLHGRSRVAPGFSKPDTTTRVSFLPKPNPFGPPGRHSNPPPDDKWLRCPFAVPRTQWWTCLGSRSVTDGLCTTTPRVGGSNDRQGAQPQPPSDKIVALGMGPRRGCCLDVAGFQGQDQHDP